MGATQPLASAKAHGAEVEYRRFRRGQPAPRLRISGLAGNVNYMVGAVPPPVDERAATARWRLTQ